MMLGLFLILSISTAILAANYTVKPGDSLFLIGEKYGLTPQQIQSANGLTGTEIVPGQVLSIPANNSYTVVRGDTFYLIAKKYGISSQQLMSHNGLTSSYIEPGQTLTIPSNSVAKTRVATTASRGGSAHSFSREEVTLLARTVYSEARGEPYEGQVAVAAVVLNRIKHSDFPNNVRGVIFEPLAFSAVADGQFWLQPNQAAYNAANDALEGWDPSNGALYYWNPVTATSKWIWSRTVTHQLGKHVFGF